MFHVYIYISCILYVDKIDKLTVTHVQKNDTHVQKIDTHVH